MLGNLWATDASIPMGCRPGPGDRPRGVAAQGRTDKNQNCFLLQWKCRPFGVGTLCIWLLSWFSSNDQCCGQDLCQVPWGNSAKPGIPPRWTIWRKDCVWYFTEKALKKFIMGKMRILLDYLSLILQVVFWILYAFFWQRWVLVEHGGSSLWSTVFSSCSWWAWLPCIM